MARGIKLYGLSVKITIDESGTNMAATPIFCRLLYAIATGRSKHFTSLQHPGKKIM